MSKGGVFGAALILSVVSSTAAFADPPPLQAYAALPALQDPRLSPDGTTLALVAPVNDRLSLVTRKVDSGQSVVIDTGNAQASWFHWKDSNRLVAGVRYSSYSTHDEFSAHTRLAFVDADGSNSAYAKFFLESIGEPQFQDRLVNTEPDLPGEVLVGVAPMENTSHPDLFRVDVHTGQSTNIASRGHALRWLSDAKGEALAVVEDRWDDKTRRFVGNKVLVRLHSGGEWQTLYDDDEAIGRRFNPIGFAKDRPSVLYVLADTDKGHLEARDYDLSTHALGAVLAAGPSCDAETLGGDQELLGVAAPCNPESVHYFDPAWQHDYLVIRKALHAQAIRVIDRSQDGQRTLAGVRRSLVDPESYWLLDRHGEKPDLSLLAESYEGLKPEDSQPMTRISYEARDKEAIPGFLTLPGGHSGPVPFVVMVHDGPTAHNGITFNWQVQFLASRGYGVFQPQFRGSSGFGQAFEEAGQREWSGRMAEDIADGTRWLVSQKLADPSRICILGTGFGGYSALTAVIKDPSLYACAAAFGAISDLDKQAKRMKKFVIADSNWPKLTDNKVAPVDLSPADHAAEIKVPVLLVHGKKDVAVPPEQSEEMESALQRAGKPVRAVYLDQSDSGLSRSADRVAWLGELEKFLAANLHNLAEAAK